MAENVSFQMDERKTGNGEIEIAIMEGDSEEQKNKMGRLLVMYLSRLSSEKKRINYNRREILDMVLKTKEREKEGKMRDLRELTDEARKIDGELRKGKLGRWNKGLQKGVVQYVGSTYDEERREMENEIKWNAKHNKYQVVTNMNREIYEMEQYEEDIVNAEIEYEELSMRNIPDDEDDPENDYDYNLEYEGSTTGYD